MPRIEIRSAFGYSYQIDTLDTRLLGEWLAETLNRIRPTAAAPAQVMIWPSMGPAGEADWIADARVLGQRYPVRTPREVVEAMAQQIVELERLAGR
jgi:hypothetical protein